MNNYPSECWISLIVSSTQNWKCTASSKSAPLKVSKFLEISRETVEEWHSCSLRTRTVQSKHWSLSKLRLRDAMCILRLLSRSVKSNLWLVSLNLLKPPFNKCTNQLSKNHQHKWTKGRKKWLLKNRSMLSSQPSRTPPLKNSHQRKNNQTLTSQISYSVLNELN